MLKLANAKGFLYNVRDYGFYSSAMVGGGGCVVVEPSTESEFYNNDKLKCVFLQSMEMVVLFDRLAIYFTKVISLVPTTIACNIPTER